MLKEPREKVEYRLDEEALKALFEGKKLVFDYDGQPVFVLYPPRYGVFMTHQKFIELEKKVYAKAFEELVNLLEKIGADNEKYIN